MFKRYFAPEGDGGGGGSEAPAATEQAPVAEQAPQEASEWFWTDGVKGTDKPPEWYDGKKYKSVAEQARALPESRKRIGTLEQQVNDLTAKVGPAAPEKYDFAIPERYANVLEVKADDPLLSKLMETGKKHNLSQDAMSAIYELGTDLIFNYEVIDPKQMKEVIGENADARMKSLSEWAGANLNEEQAQMMNAALSSWQHPAAVFQLLESVVAGKRQAALPNVNDDAAAGSVSLADVEREQFKTNEKGQRLFDIDPAHREKVRKMRAQVVGVQQYQEVVGRR